MTTLKIKTSTGLAPVKAYTYRSSASKVGICCTVAQAGDPAFVAAVAAKGTGWLRFDAFWAYIETAAGSYSWGALDAAINTTLAAGMKPLIIIQTTPQWVSGSATVTMGPVTAAAVVLDIRRLPQGLNDSKKLSAAARDRLADAIRESADWAVAHVWIDEIDSLNIYHASHLAMCRALAGHADLTRLLLEHTWTWLRRQIAPAIAADSTTVVRRRLAVLGRLLAALLAAVAEAQGAADAVRDDLVAWCTQEAGDSLVELLVPALHAADDWPRDQQGASGMRDLAGVTSELLEKRASAPQRAADDWSIELRAGCSCDLCEKLVAFLADPTERVLEWPIAQAKREHVHRRLDSAELPVTHVTRRIGSPYTLVVTKTSDLFDTETHRRTDATRELTWLARRSA